MKDKDGKARNNYHWKTTRQADIAMKLNIDELDPGSASNLLIARYEYYWSQGYAGVNARLLNELNSASNEEKNLILKVAESQELPKEYMLDLRRGAKHPLIIFYIASLLLEKEVLEQSGYSSENKDITSVLIEIIKNENYGVKNTTKDWEEWVTKKAFDRVIKNPNCKTNSRTLIRRRRGRFSNT